MRILIVHDYAPLIGGAEVINDLLVHGLRARGHDVRLFTSTAGLGGEDEPPDYLCLGTTSRWRTLLQSGNPWAAIALRRVLKDFAPDVVHLRIFLTQLSPLILPLLGTIPTLYHEVWYRAMCPTGSKLLPTGQRCEHRAGAPCLTSGCLPLHDWALLMAQRRLLRKWRHVFRVIVANSQSTAEALARDGFTGITIVPDGLPGASDPALLDGLPTAVYVGRLVPEKGVDVLLRAFSEVVRRQPSASLDIVGDGSARCELEALATHLGIAASVRFHGYQSRSRSEGIARRAWVQVVPSRWPEPFGLVAVEAMMRGVPVIASQTGGLAEIVLHEVTGVRIPPGDVDALADAMGRILRYRNLAFRLGNAGRRLAESQYGVSRFLDRMLAVYASVIAGP
jgi:glycosyltransferase involved in cell wall biosynthesis